VDGFIEFTRERHTMVVLTSLKQIHTS